MDHRVEDTTKFLNEELQIIREADVKKAMAGKAPAARPEAICFIRIGRAMFCRERSNRHREGVGLKSNVHYKG